MRFARQGKAVLAVVAYGVFFVGYYLLIIFATSSFNLTTETGPVRWDRGYKSTVCVVKNLGLEGCGFEIIREEYYADGD